MYQKLLKYYSKHPLYTGFVHLFMGLGLGILIARPLGIHPLRYGVALLAIGVLGKLYPLLSKTK